MNLPSQKGGHQRGVEAHYGILFLALFARHLLQRAGEIGSQTFAGID